MRKPFLLTPVLGCFLLFVSACQGDDTGAKDLSPLPVSASPPYVCDYVPLEAVKLMTGVQDPLVRGSFDLAASDGAGVGSCTAYQGSGDRLRALQITLTPAGNEKEVRNKLEGGASPLPEIVDGSIGYYFKSADGENEAAYAMLVRGKAGVIIQLGLGVEGRDSAADVLGLMKLIAPKLVAGTGSPSVSAASPSPENS